MKQARFLTVDEVRELRERWGTPVYVYDEAGLWEQAQAALAFPHAFGLTVRFAMKSLPNGSILRRFQEWGLQMDASSGYEVWRAMRAGIDPKAISLSSQELPADLDALLRHGVAFNACSLHQLDAFGRLCRGGEVGIRVNPGLGSGGTNRTNTGGPASSFGIWKEQLAEAQEVARRWDLCIRRFHSHIGSGSDGAVWERVAHMNLELVERLPDVTTVNLGGGFKVGRMPGEASTDMRVVGEPVAAEFRRFAERTGRELHLEIEPGTFFTANNGCLVSTVQDKVSTGEEGYTFLKLDTGMTEILRPGLYGAQHPLVIMGSGDAGTTEPVIVVGHCCESGDLLTPAPGNPELLAPRELPVAGIGDLCVIEGTGGYCSAMAAKHYNSFPEAPEVLKRRDGLLVLIRKRESLEELTANEIPG